MAYVFYQPGKLGQTMESTEIHSYTRNTSRQWLKKKKEKNTYCKYKYLKTREWLFSDSEVLVDTIRNKILKQSQFLVVASFPHSHIHILKGMAGWDILLYHIH